AATGTPGEAPPSRPGRPARPRWPTARSFPDTAGGRQRGGPCAGGPGHWRPAVERTPTMRWHAVTQRWLRGVRGWWPDRNPLRRRCDRAEAAIVTMLVAVFVAGAPLLGLAAGGQAGTAGPAPPPPHPARGRR